MNIYFLLQSLPMIFCLPAISKNDLLLQDDRDLKNYTFAGVESVYSGVARCRLRYWDGSTELVEISVSEVGDEIVLNLKSVY